MNVSSEKSVSLWMSTPVLDDAPPLRRDIDTDGLVVGSGIAGMSVAYELAKRGKKVVIFDRGPIGKGMTSRTTAHLAAQCDDRFHEMIGRRGKRLATAWYDSQTASTYDSQTLSTLEQLRMLLGLSLPWLSLRTRWQSTQRPSGFTRIGGGYAVEDLARDLRKNFSPDLATKGRKNSEL